LSEEVNWRDVGLEFLSHDERLVAYKSPRLHWVPSGTWGNNLLAVGFLQPPSGPCHLNQCFVRAARIPPEANVLVDTSRRQFLQERIRRLK
jgi:hypothetical protein